MDGKNMNNQTQAEQIVSYVLRHPQNNMPSTARVLAYYFEAGRAVGLQLRFPDGLTVCLTYGEIRELQGETDEHN